MAEAQVRSSGAASTQRVVVEPRRGWLPVNWRELWRHRELLYFLTWRDIKVRYKQTVLGALWAVLQPLVKMVVLTVIFKGIAGMDSEGYPYPVFLFSGLLAWQLFAKSVQRSSISVVAGAHLISKVYFPRLIIPIASVGATLVDHALSFLVLAGIMLWYGVAPGPAVLLVVPLAAATAFAALGIGTLLSALTVAYRDFGYVVGFLIETWFFLTPVVWPLAKVPERYRLLMALNPMCGIVETYRSAILPGRPLDWTLPAVSLAVAFCLFVIGLYYFRRVERHFADII